MSQHITAGLAKDDEPQGVMSRLEFWAYGHGYCGKSIPRSVRKLCAKTALHRAWLSGHNYCKWGWKVERDREEIVTFERLESHYNGGGIETVQGDEEQALKSVAWRKGYSRGITFGYDSLEDENPYQGQEAADWNEGRSQGLADIYKME